MGITNTIAQLKAYFETWHEDAYDTLHKSSSDAITAINTRVQALESWLNNTRKTQIDQDLKQFENFISGYVNSNKDSVTKTLRNLVDSINKHENFIYGSSSNSSIDTKFSNIKKWTYLNAGDIERHSNQDYHAYVNTELRLICLHAIDIAEYYTSYKNKWKPLGSNIALTYKPKRTVYFTASPYTVGRIKPDGAIEYKSIYTAQTSITIPIYAMWFY